MMWIVSQSVETQLEAASGDLLSSIIIASAHCSFFKKKNIFCSLSTLQSQHSKSNALLLEKKYFLLIVVNGFLQLNSFKFTRYFTLDKKVIQHEIYCNSQLTKPPFRSNRKKWKWDDFTRMHDICMVELFLFLQPESSFAKSHQRWCKPTSI